MALPLLPSDEMTSPPPRLLVISRTLHVIPGNNVNNNFSSSTIGPHAPLVKSLALLSSPPFVPAAAASSCGMCEQHTKTAARLKADLELASSQVAQLREEISRRAKDDASRIEKLEARLAEMDSEIAKRTHDSIVELEGHKSRALKAEREHDAAQFQLQEVERRYRSEREEEHGIRENLNSKAHELERRANIIELQRNRADAEASSARQQLEHWRSATRQAQDEAASLRAEVESLRESRGFADHRVAFRAVVDEHRTLHEPPPPRVTVPLEPQVDKGVILDRIRAIEAESHRLTEELGLLATFCCCCCCCFHYFLLP